MATDTLHPVRTSPAAPLPPKSATRDLVVLTHGIASTRWFLAPLALRLRRRGFDTYLHSYFSLRGSNRQLGERFAARLERLSRQFPDRTIHIVAHSMGSIVTRCAAQVGLPDRIGRIVMVGPPNRGSHVARRLASVYGRLAPTLAELSDAPESFVNRLPPSLDEHEVGIVVAGLDRVVRAESTLLEGCADQITLGSLHTSILWRQRTADCVARFLRTGRFADQ